MELNLAKTIEGFSNYIKVFRPDLIIIHGDRVEAFAGAIVGALNNVLVGHIEGGELSGTIDELIRHSISKMSHIHFVANEEAKRRLIQMGELENSIFIIGSPDIDIMLSDHLPTLEYVKSHYEILFEKYAILVYHPVTTEIDQIQQDAKNLVDVVIESNVNYIVINPNNDEGSDYIFQAFEHLKNQKNFRIYPSIRFENFLVLLKNADFVIGNSSSGIREAPYYGTPTINIGTRQTGRSKNPDIIHCLPDKKEITNAILKALSLKLEPKFLWGDGKSDIKFLDILLNHEIWKTSTQKRFNDII
jgi:UDP-N-acetylglucosamine 2-epimerase (hydrolysing)